MLDTQLILILLVEFLVLEISIILVAIFFNSKLDRLKEIWRVELRKAAQKLESLEGKLK